MGWRGVCGGGGGGFLARTPAGVSRGVVACAQTFAKAGMPQKANRRANMANVSPVLRASGRYVPLWTRAMVKSINIIVMVMAYP